MTLKIYFAGSIRGGRDDKQSYLELITYLQEFGVVLTEHVGDKKLTNMGEDGPTEEFVYDRDVSWIKESDIVIAEVSTPSLGVGYELAFAESLNKRVLCLYKPQENKRLSAMIKGNKNLVVKEYTNLEEAKIKIKEFLSD